MIGPVGVVGLGRMGAPMARAIAAAGIDVVGHDIRDLAPGIPVQPDPGSFAARLTTLLTVVRDMPETEAALFGDQALIARATHLQRLVICSTLAPRDLDRLREHVPPHIAMVDAPMSGAIAAAEARQLTFLLGGADADLLALLPLFEAMGRRLHRMGPFGSGMLTKVLNNMVAAASLATTRLALDWADAHGLPRDALLDAMTASSGRTWVSERFDQIEFAAHGYEAGNSIAVLTKDVHCAIAAAPEAADTTIPTVLAEALRRLRPLGEAP